MPNASKPIWNILCAKSERERSKAGLLFAKMKKKRKQALDRKEKLELMLEEYNQTLNGVLKKIRWVLQVRIRHGWTKSLSHN